MHSSPPAAPPAPPAARPQSNTNEVNNDLLALQPCAVSRRGGRDGRHWRWHRCCWPRRRPPLQRAKRSTAAPSAPSSDITRGPLILGHRGASFHLPEHTLPAYRLAFELGADYIEPDLVTTKDGVLIAMHSVDLNVTSNVHDHNNGEFRDRARQSESEQRRMGVLCERFHEVQKLTVRQRVSEPGSRTSGYDHMFRIPSFTQIVDLLHDWNTRELPLIGRPGKVGGVPGVFAELKRSQFFQEDANISIADLFLDELATHPKASDLLFDHITLCDDLKHDEYRVPPLVVHSFESDALEYLKRRFKERWMDFVEEDAILASGVVNATGEDDEVDHPWIPPLIYLVSTDTCQTEEFWFSVASLHISGIGVNKDCLLPSPDAIASNDEAAIKHAKREAREWVAKAHSERLAVYPWTIRPEIERLAHVGGVPPLFHSVNEELKYYFCEVKVDGAWAEDITTAQIVSAEGCDGYAAEEKDPKMGNPNSDTVCTEQGKFLGLSFLAVGAFAGSVLTCIAFAALTKKGYIGGARTPPGPVRSLQLREIDTAIDHSDEEEEDEII
ncbi:LOW QUALITY PROTEIN: hypothetical protein ACHAXT_008800 [Thalassiosira profunda]